MKKKWTLMFAGLLVMTMVFAACSNQGASNNKANTKEEERVEESDNKKEGLGEPVTLTATLTAVSTDTHAQAMEEFKKYVEEKSEGNIKVDLYTDATLFTQEEEVAAVVGGDADMTLTSASWLTTNSPWISMFTSGYIFNSYDHMTSVLNGEIGQDVFNKVSDEQGIRPLGAWYLGSREISLSEDKKISTPEDLNGINLRMPNTEAWMFLGKALGANPTPISFSELYLSLQTGVVDGQDNPLPTVESAKFYEVQKSITLTDHLVDSIWPAINSGTWEKLTDVQKEIILEGVEVGRVFCDKQNLKRESELVEFFKSKGLAVYEADKAAFVKEVQDRYLNDPISKTWDMDIYQKIQDLGKQFD